MASGQPNDVVGTNGKSVALHVLGVEREEIMHAVHDHDYVMVNEDVNSSQGQVQSFSCSCYF